MRQFWTIKKSSTPKYIDAPEQIEVIRIDKTRENRLFVEYRDEAVRNMGILVAQVFAFLEVTIGSTYHQLALVQQNQAIYNNHASLFPVLKLLRDDLCCIHIDTILYEVMVVDDWSDADGVNVLLNTDWNDKVTRPTLVPERPVTDDTYHETMSLLAEKVGHSTDSRDESIELQEEAAEPPLTALDD